MELFLTEPQHIASQKEKWTGRKTFHEQRRDVLLAELSLLPRLESLCKQLCVQSSPQTAASLLQPGLIHEVRQLAQKAEKNKRELQSQLTHANEKIEKLETRLARLESPEYRAEVIDEAAADALERFEPVFEQYKKDHTRVHEVQDRKIRELSKKQRITIEDVKELAEEVEQAIEAPTPEAVLPSAPTLLEQIRAGIPLRRTPRPSPLVTPQEREGLAEQLARALSGIRQAVAPEEEEEEEA